MTLLTNPAVTLDLLRVTFKVYQFIMAKKIELYEIIANRLQAGENPPSPVDGTYEIPLPQRLSKNSGREIVLSLDAAFVIFVIFLLLLGTAYSLGLQKGEQREREIFRPLNTVVATGDLAQVKTLKDESPAGDEKVKIPADRYTLKLVAGADLAALEKVRADLLANLVISKNNVDAFIFDNRGKYLLTLGVFPSQDDELLKSMQKFISEQKINEIAYKNTSVELISDLGKAVK